MLGKLHIHVQVVSVDCSFLFSLNLEISFNEAEGIVDTRCFPQDQ